MEKVFKVKAYDLGGEVERVGYYQDVVDKITEKRNNPILTDKPKLKFERSEEEKKELNKERSIRRTKTKVRRLAQAYNMRYMWTLTFAKTEININGRVYSTGDYDDVWHLWKMFIQRCRRNGLDFDYICTVEVQEERYKKYGDKVYHFHFLTNKNIPINYEKAKKSGQKFNMSSLWGHGFVNVQFQKSKRKAHLYIVKYVTKLVDEMGSGKQRYRVKQGLEVPVEEFFLNDHVEFYLSAGDNIKRNSYDVLGNKLEIFWMIYSKT